MKFFCWSCKTYLFYMNQRSQSKMDVLTFKYRTFSKWIIFQGRSGTQLPTYLDKVPILLDFPDLIRSIVDRESASGRYFVCHTPKRDADHESLNLPQQLESIKSSAVPGWGQATSSSVLIRFPLFSHLWRLTSTYTRLFHFWKGCWTCVACLWAWSCSVHCLLWFCHLPLISSC